MRPLFESQLFRTNQQIIFRFEIEQGPKVAEIEVTMPNGQLKTQEIFNDTIIGYNKFDEEIVRATGRCGFMTIRALNAPAFRNREA